MAETILDLTTRVQLEPLKTGLADAVRTVNSSTASIGSSFSNLASSTDGSMARIEAEIAAMRAEFAKMSASVIDAMAVATAAIKEGSGESSFALRELGAQFLRTATVAEAASGTIVGAMAGITAAVAPALAAFLPIIAIGEALTVFERDAVRIHKFSEETGVATDRVQEFETAMALLHVAPEQAETSLVRLNRSLTLAAEGSKTQAELFNRLGVDIQAWKSGQIDLIGVLEQIQAKTSQDISVNERLGISMQIAGRNARDMALVLGITSEQFESLMSIVKAYGGTVSPQAIEQFVRMSQEMTLLWQVIKSQLAEAFVALLPIIKGVIVGLSELALYVRVVWEVFVQLVSVVFAAGGVIAGAVLIMAGQWELGTKVMKASVQDFEDGFKRSMDNIIASNARAAGTANILFSSSVDKMLGDLSRLKAGGSEDILAGITGGSSRVEQFKATLQEMQSSAQNFRSTTAAEDVAFWQTILTTEKLNAKEQLEVERELNSAKHALAVEYYHAQIALDQEFVRTSRVGSEERKFSVQKEYEDTVTAVRASIDKQISEVNRLAAAGKISNAEREASLRELNSVDVSSTTEVVNASRKVLTEQLSVDKQAVADIKESVATEVAATQAGSTARVEAIARGIAQIKALQDTLSQGKPAKLAGEPELPTITGPNAAAESQVQVQTRRTASAEMQKDVDALVAHLEADYRSETNEFQKQVIEQEKVRIESIARSAAGEQQIVDASKRTTSELISDAMTRSETSVTAAKRTADEQIKEIDRLQSFDLISFNQRTSMSRAVLEAEKNKTTAIIATKIDEMKAEAQSAIATIEAEKLKQEAYLRTQLAGEQLANAITLADAQANNARVRATQEADAKIEAELKRLQGIYEALGAKQKQVADDVANHQMQQAQKAANIISQSFTSAFDRMLTTHTNFANVMTQFWNNMVVGFEKMGLQILAKAIQQIAMRVIAEATGQTTIVALHQAAATETGTIDLLASLKTITHAAAAAAAKAYEAMAGIPVIGPALGAVAAAATFAAVMAFASAEGGAGTIPKEMMVLAHANEMVLPAPLAGGLRSVIASAQHGLLATHDQFAKVHTNESILPAHLTQGIQGMIAAGGAGGSGGTGGPGGGGGAAGSHVTNNHVELEYHSHESPGIQKEELTGLIRQAIRTGELG